MTGHCQDCKHWNNNFFTYIMDLDKTQWGDCRRLPIAFAHFRLSDMEPTLAFLSEATGDRSAAWLTTHADYGCPMWEAKETP